MSSILLIGPMTNKNNPSKIGGAIVLFENLLENISKEKIEFYVIDTNKENYSNIIVAYICIIYKILFRQFSYQVLSLHSSRDYIILAPLIIMFWDIKFQINISVKMITCKF